VRRPRHLTEDQAARRIGMSPSYLRKLRKFGGGPTFIRFGRSVRYSEAELDAWVANRVRETADESSQPVAA
jgi:excisionase family DNA binding protein